MKPMFKKKKQSFLSRHRKKPAEKFAKPVQLSAVSLTSVAPTPGVPSTTARKIVFWCFDLRPEGHTKNGMTQQDTNKKWGGGQGKRETFEGQRE